MDLISHQRTRSALGRHHDRHRPHPLQCGLAHCVRVCVLPVCWRHHRLEACRAVAAHHGRRWGGRVCGDHQSLGWWEGVAAIGKGCCCRRCGLCVARQGGRARRRNHRTTAVSCVLGLPVSVWAVGGIGEGLTGVSVTSRVGVGIIVRFGVMPVAAVVGVGGGQRVVLWGWGIGMESLHWWWPLRRKVIFSVEETFQREASHCG